MKFSDSVSRSNQAEEAHAFIGDFDSLDLRLRIGSRARCKWKERNGKSTVIIQRSRRKEKRSIRMNRTPQSVISNQKRRSIRLWLEWKFVENRLNPSSLSKWKACLGQRIAQWSPAERIATWRNRSIYRGNRQWISIDSSGQNSTGKWILGKTERHLFDALHLAVGNGRLVGEIRSDDSVGIL